MPQLTLEEELIQIFGHVRSARNREILIGYYGWNDGAGIRLTKSATDSALPGNGFAKFAQS